MNVWLSILLSVAVLIRFYLHMAEMEGRGRSLMEMREGKTDELGQPQGLAKLKVTGYLK